MKYDEKDVPQFQEEVCKKTCKMKGKCITDGQNKRWFVMCPHYFNWKLQIPPSFVAEQIQWEQEHPEEAEAKHKQAIERAKAWKASQKTSKKSTKIKKED